MSIENVIRDTLKVGMVFDNPGGGTTEIVSISGTSIYYKRKNSKMQLKFSDIDSSYYNFKDGRVTTNMLKGFKPKVFNTRENGHDCNCTVLFLILKNAGLTKGEIYGRPFGIEFI